MQLPVMPPVAPMLAKPVPGMAALPAVPMSFEPKWDGFRSVVFRDGNDIEIGSRNERPMTRFFPELVRAFRDSLPARCVVDGEIVLVAPGTQRLDFELLQLRLHPAASRVRLLAATTPARFVAFDLLAVDDQDLMPLPFAARRGLLESAFAGAELPVHLTPTTTETDRAAAWFDQFEGAGLDGLIAKPLDGPYQQGIRVMFKLKHERTADCVVAGYRVHKAGGEVVGSLMLGLYTDGGELASVGVIGAFPMATRRQLFAELQPLVTSFDGHPWDWSRFAAETDRRRYAAGSRWNAGKDLSFVPLRPERVVEVRYDHMEGRRFRHTAQFLRWRPDRDPASCRYDQLDEPVGYALDDVLTGGPR
ncbi:MAG TPA: ATP-dependent DNA ligase [Dermatophilaceae bacterium]|nr:ATP-dependent DNA ligase [Dermatophilaceae bacterium]